MARKPKKSPALDPEEARLWADYRSAPGDVARRNALIEQYLPLVKSTARRVRFRLASGMALDDLIDDGLFGLIDAIEAFDPDRGLRFATFAFWRIRGAMIDGVRDLDPLARLARAQVSRLQKARERVACRGPATAADVAAELGISETRLAALEAEGKRARHVSIDLIRQHRDGDRLHEISRDEVDEREPPPSRRTQRSDLFRLVLRGCNRSERLILILYYYEDLTFKEIGATLGLSESRISQMHTQLVKRLRRALDGRQSEFTGSEPGAR